MSELDSELVGALTAVTPGAIRGWALRIGNDEPVEVAIAVNGVSRAVVVADRPSRAGAASGMSANGRCGFVLKLDAAQRLGPNDQVSARVIGADRDLGNSPMGCDERPRKAPDKAGALRDTAAQPKPPPAAIKGRSSLRVTLDSIWAFFLRELRGRYGTTPSGYFWAIVQPILFVVLLREVHSLFGGAEGDLYGVSSLYFFAVGVMTYYMYQHAYGRGTGSMKQFSALYGYRQIAPIDVMLARAIIEFVLMIAVFLILLTSFWWVGLEVSVEYPVEYIAVIAELFCFTVGVSLLADVYTTKYPPLQTVVRLIQRPLFFISGVFFTMDSIPPRALVFLWWNPLLHAIDLGRGALLAGYESPGSWLYLTLSSLGALTLGLAAYRRHLSELRRE
jgi:capsular polysaccharide transport system permease protein